ncbi:MAG: amidohydrolase family protein [Chitinophagaceae bacterium]
MKKNLQLCFIILLPLLSVAQNTLVIKNVSVINVISGKIEKNNIVVIRGNRISSVSKKTVDLKNATVIDGSGKYLIPGLWDMHAHTLTDKRYEYSFPLLIANGITGVREMGNNLPVEEVNRIRKNVEEGKLTGPRLGALTYKILDGPGTRLGVATATATAEEAKTLVKLYKESGADFIKPYNLLTAEIYKAIAEEAGKQKIPVEGHVPFSMTAMQVSDMGQKTIEHNFDILVSCSTEENELRKNITQQNWGQAEAKAALTYDKQKARKLFDRMAHNGTWSCPTIIFYKPLWFIANEDEALKDSLLKYLPKAQVAGWHTPFQNLSRNTIEEHRLKHYEMRSRIVKEMHDAHVNILAGTDAGALFVVPGFGLHLELQALVEAGLSNSEVLKIATFNPAKFLQKEKDFGTVEKGKIADLVLLNANPLENIANTRKIYAVIANGKLLERKDLDQLLDKVKEMAAK